MKLFIAVSILVTAAAAEPSGVATLAYGVVPVAAPIVVSPSSSQYHIQDALGQYSYGYSNPQSSKAEARSVNGITVGGYNYIDGGGKLQSVQYSSDANGFRVAASNLPVPPAIPSVPAVSLPVPVEDTPEVVEARNRHLAAIEEVRTRATLDVNPLALAALPVQLRSTPLIPAPLSAQNLSDSTSSANASTTPVPDIAVEPITPITPAAETSDANATVPPIELRSLFPAEVRSVLPSLVVAPSLPLAAVRTVGTPVSYGYSINSLTGGTVILTGTGITYSLPLVAPVAAPVAPASGATPAPTEAAQETSESSE